MVILVLVITVAFAPILVALFGPGLWSLMRQLMWTALIHPSNPVIVFPRGWRRRVAWLARPSKRQPAVSDERRRVLRDTM